ncbi:ion transporter [Aquimarina longa]|uniref:ion transporter n=1 Tax=Aquimarina longa TaxID=1080221 RepID=UPI0007846AC9|nr:ion transporter [Aquimarina longa]
MKLFLQYWLSDDENPKKYLVDLCITGIIFISILLLCIESVTGELPYNLVIVDHCIIIIFIIEYLARFYVCSDFRKDCREKGFFFAIGQKIKWMLRWSSIIDFLAILPVAHYFKTFRMLKYLRLIRMIRLFKAFRIIRDIHKLTIILRGMREENRVFYIFFATTVGILLATSFGLYLSENPHGDQTFSSYTDSLLYSLKTIELIDDTPTTSTGKILSGFLLVSNMAIFGFFVSITINKIKLVMDTLTSGKIQKLNLTDHTIICGYTKSSQSVIKDLLKDRKNHNNVVLITTKPVEDISGIIYVNADYTEYQSLEKVNITEAKNAIIFSESGDHDTIRDIDLRTVMTVFHIEKNAPHVHTIAEINDEHNAEIIQDKINGDEIIYKELIDAKIIGNCIKNPNISALFYALFENNGKCVQNTTLVDLKITIPVDVKKVKLLFIEQDKTFLGIIDSQNRAYLSPPNAMVIDEECQLIYI